MQTLPVLSADWLEFEPVLRTCNVRPTNSVTGAATRTQRLRSRPMKTLESPKTGTAPVRPETGIGQSAHRQPAAQPSPASSCARGNILLVDDDPTVRDSLNDVLLGEGYRVIPAENGRQAVDLATQLPLDLALLDLNMPVMNGWDTFELLTAEHPSMPIIIITARPNQLFMALNAGAGALLEKPMDIPTLLRTIEKLLTETAEERLARLIGKNTEFAYKPATANRV
jgi:two-component system, cell cycle response regulator DivK